MQQLYIKLMSLQNGYLFKIRRNKYPRRADNW